MIIDSHTHIDMPDFDKDRDHVIARAREAGVRIILNVGFDIKSSRVAVKLAEQYAEVFVAVGIHPHEANKLKEGDIEQLSVLSSNKKVVAIGEMGLDFHKNYSPKDIQVKAFEEQLNLAENLNLPVIIHCREAHREVLEILSAWVGGQADGGGDRKLRGVIHCFSGNREEAERYFELGFLISLAGPVTYPSSDAVQIASDVPLDKILVETDAPFLTPQIYRGRRNEPAYVAYVVEKIAEVRGIVAEKVSEMTTENAQRLFRFAQHDREALK